jgi:hypothetical protein
MYKYSYQCVQVLMACVTIRTNICFCSGSTYGLYLESANFEFQLGC